LSGDTVVGQTLVDISKTEQISRCLEKPSRMTITDLKNADVSSRPRLRSDPTTISSQQQSSALGRAGPMTWNSLPDSLRTRYPTRNIATTYIDMAL